MFQKVLPLVHRERRKETSVTSEMCQDKRYRQVKRDTRGRELEGPHMQLGRPGRMLPRAG